MSKHPFVYTRRVHFGDADPARIAYTVRFLDYAMEALEGWLREVLEYDWYRFVVELGIGAPVVQLDMDFSTPLRPGDLVELAVRVTDVGRSSVSFEISAKRNGREASYGTRMKIVFVDATTVKSIPIPEEFRARIERYKASCEG